jgi:hypothetical protein
MSSVQFLVGGISDTTDLFYVIANDSIYDVNVGDTLEFELLLPTNNEDQDSIVSMTYINDTLNVTLESGEVLSVEIQSGSGTTNTIPLWSSSTALSDSWLSQASNTLSLASANAFRIIGGSTASRPVGQSGSIYYNTDKTRHEYYNGTEWYNLLSNNSLTPYKYYTVDTNGDLVDGLIYAEPLTDSYWFGNNAGSTNVGSTAQVAIGTSAGSNNSGGNSTMIGYFAGQSNTGVFLNAFGRFAARNNIGANVNAYGLSAGQNNTGSNVNLFGPRAGLDNIGSDSNIFGSDAGRDAKGSGLQAFGNSAGRYQQGADNICIGLRAGQSKDYTIVNPGDRNILIGTQTAMNITKGDNNIVIGESAGDDLTEGSDNVLIGSNAELSDTSDANAIVIGHDVVGNGSNTIKIGNSSAVSAQLNNYTFNIDQTTTGKDGQVLTFNETNGEIELQQGAPAMVTGWTTNSTNASAEITVGHGLGTTPQAVTIQGVSDGDYNYAVTSADGINFTVKVRNGGSLHTSSSISFYWVAFGSTEE